MDHGAAAEGIALAVLAGMTLMAAAILIVGAILATIGLAFVFRSTLLARWFTGVGLGVVVTVQFLFAAAGPWTSVFLGPARFWSLLLGGLTAYVVVVSAFVLSRPGEAAPAMANRPEPPRPTTGLSDERNSL